MNPNGLFSHLDLIQFYCSQFEFEQINKPLLELLEYLIDSNYSFSSYNNRICMFFYLSICLLVCFLFLYLIDFFSIHLIMKPLTVFQCVCLSFCLLFFCLFVWLSLYLIIKCLLMKCLLVCLCICFYMYLYLFVCELIGFFVCLCIQW